MPVVSRRSPYFYLVIRLILFVLALPCVYFGGAGAAFFYRHRAGNLSREAVHLSPLTAPTSATRLLVFAPHCDDETLGCAGLIQKTVTAGGAARVVMVTNGDGYRTAVERNTRELRVEPEDYIRFATLRQAEAYHALGQIGLSQDNVLFLGYPDRGLMPIWNSHWQRDDPYISGYTRCSSSPYENTFDPLARYCGSDLLKDIKATMRNYRPTLVTVTHPSDDHPDHAAAAAFVARAIQELQADPKERNWASRIQLRYYLVHRGDWPVPQGAHPTDRLLPPSEMAYLDTRWTTLPLKPNEVAKKEQSVELYPSQTSLMRRFLTSFARQNELYGEVAPTELNRMPDGVVHVDANPREWETLPPMLLDPVRDNVLRDFQGGGDIRSLYVCRDDQSLYLRLDTRQPISGRITYTVRIRAFDAQGETENAVFMLRLHPYGAKNPVSVAAKGRILEAAVPWSQVVGRLTPNSVRTLAIAVETSIAGVEVDKTGIRFVTL